MHFLSVDIEGFCVFCSVLSRRWAQAFSRFRKLFFSCKIPHVPDSVGFALLKQHWGRPPALWVSKTISRVNLHGGSVPRCEKLTLKSQVKKWKETGDTAAMVSRFYIWVLMGLKSRSAGEVQSCKISHGPVRSCFLWLTLQNWRSLECHRDFMSQWNSGIRHLFACNFPPPRFTITNKKRSRPIRRKCSCPILGELHLDVWRFVQIMKKCKLTRLRCRNTLGCLAEMSKSCKSAAVLQVMTCNKSWLFFVASQRSQVSNAQARVFLLVEHACAARTWCKIVFLCYGKFYCSSKQEYNKS